MSWQAAEWTGVDNSLCTGCCVISCRSEALQINLSSQAIGKYIVVLYCGLVVYRMGLCVKCHKTHLS